MTTPLAALFFLPSWLRPGLSTRIAGTSGARGTLRIAFAGRDGAGRRHEDPAGGSDRRALRTRRCRRHPVRRRIVRTEPLNHELQISSRTISPSSNSTTRIFSALHAGRAVRRQSPTDPMGSAGVMLREDEFKDPRPGQGAFPFIDISRCDSFRRPANLGMGACALREGQDHGDPPRSSMPMQRAHRPGAAIRPSQPNPDEARARSCCARAELFAPNKACRMRSSSRRSKADRAQPKLGLDPAPRLQARGIARGPDHHPERATLSPTHYPYYHR